ncbi:MAG: hypothetical protein N2Z58_01075 [Fervidobacterium sp.]|nr:hypothetical protein [Fervidobacterium sp.]
MSTLIAILTIITGSYLSTRLDNLLISRLTVAGFLIITGFLVRNPILSIFLTILLLFSKTLHSPIKKDVIKDLQSYLFNKLMVRNQTYLMLVFTGGIFLGLSLPAVKNYPVTISIFIVLTTLLIYLVEYSNKKSFEEKIRKFQKTSDHLEALKEAFELMSPFKQINTEELIKNRLEVWKNYNQKQASKN